ALAGRAACVGPETEVNEMPIYQTHRRHRPARLPMMTWTTLKPEKKWRTSSSPAENGSPRSRSTEDLGCGGGCCSETSVKPCSLDGSSAMVLLPDRDGVAQTEARSISRQKL
ncbi:hypothetical protein Vretifemale_20652, partial [Volvox reticuliferus]